MLQALLAYPPARGHPRGARAGSLPASCTPDFTSAQITREVITEFADEGAACSHC